MRRRRFQSIYRYFSIRLRCCLLIGILICFIIPMNVEAQLNFSTGWGKRDQGFQINTHAIYSSQVQLSMEQLIHEYRLLKKTCDYFKFGFSDSRKFTLSNLMKYVQELHQQLNCL